MTVIFLKMMHCSKCGKEYSDEDSYCSKCGEKLKEESSENKEEIKPYSESDESIEDTDWHSEY